MDNTLIEFIFHTEHNIASLHSTHKDIKYIKSGGVGNTAHWNNKAEFTIECENNTEHYISKVHIVEGTLGRKNSNVWKIEVFSYSQ